ncbi:MAG: hypothetical protein K0R05_3792 [Anaerocolumna sp.]|jgi:hypothetical protein|nr:hypothetical protein [Anaerocolumna sp.]
MITTQQIIEYLSEHVTDPVPEFIMQKEIYKEPAESPGYKNAYNQINYSKWYRELADEQWEDGSWGRFHTQDSKAANKQKFVTTETALRRALQLSLSKDDPIIAKCIKKMEQYVRGEETWTDRIEMHKDGGKSHLYCRPFLTAANISLFDPENLVVKPMREVFVNTLKISLSKGYFDEEAWIQENRNYRGPGLDGWNAYPLMILQSAECMSDALQRQYLNYIWHRKGGIYYLPNFPAAEKKNVEDNNFYSWLFLLECLSGFSLFSEFMHDDVLPHLLNEINRIICDDVILTPTGNVRYSESWRDKSNLKTDVILRIARIIVRC